MAMAKMPSEAFSTIRFRTRSPSLRLRTSVSYPKCANSRGRMSMGRASGDTDHTTAPSSPIAVFAA